MTDILNSILAHPATAYLLGFGGLGLLLSLALNSAHKRFDLSERQWGLATLVVGALGGVLIQETGLVSLPGNHTWVSTTLGAFAGAATAMAACGFSSVDLRATIVKAKE